MSTHGGLRTGAGRPPKADTVTHRWFIKCESREEVDCIDAALSRMSTGTTRRERLLSILEISSRT